MEETQCGREGSMEEHRLKNTFVQVMEYECCECFFDRMQLTELLKLRALSRSWKRCVDNICEKTVVFKKSWNEYLNIYGILNLFPNVSHALNVGHRGNVVDSRIILAIHKLWIDYPVSNFSILNLLFYRNNITHLVLNIDASISLLRTISRVSLSSLETLTIICSTRTSSHPIFRYQWKTPQLKTIFFGTTHPIFPQCLDMLPLMSVYELAIVNLSETQATGLEWSSSFTHVWPHIKFSNIAILRCMHVIPLTVATMLSFVNALKYSNIIYLHLIPLTSKYATFILKNTNVYLKTRCARRTRNWAKILTEFQHRIRLE